jgi:ABC-type lipoprotein export system ATPase subunit
MTPAINVRDAYRIFPSTGGATVALQGLSLTVEPGEVVVVLGPSGSGKSTLLRAVAGFEQLSAGCVKVLGKDLGRQSARWLAAFRASEVGFLDQHYVRSLSPDLSCRETVALQLELQGDDREASLGRADELLDRVGLLERRNDRPEALSGGEQQRVAVCASIAHRPRLLLVDEPAGELDADSAAVVYRLLGELAREQQATALVVSHDPGAATISDRIVHVRDGRIVADGESLVVNRGWVRLPDSFASDARVTAEEKGGALVLRRAAGESAAEVVPLLATAPTDQAPVAELRSVTKRYGERVVLDGLSRTFQAGRLVAVVGRSGSGKTTLLHLLAGLERPTEGEIALLGRELSGLDRSALAGLRREHVALVTQEPGLVPYLTALENVELGLDLRGSATPARDRAALEDVGLGERLNQRASNLSAGERQRVAVARALAADAKLLLADEPTARLDEDNGKAVGRLLFRAARERGVAVVCATHDPALIALAEEILELEPMPAQQGQAKAVDSTRGR